MLLVLLVLLLLLEVVSRFYGGQERRHLPSIASKARLVGERLRSWLCWECGGGSETRECRDRIRMCRIWVPSMWPSRQMTGLDLARRVRPSQPTF